MKNFADRIIATIEEKGNPCIVGLDPRLDQMPSFITSCRYEKTTSEAIRSSITDFHQVILDTISPLVPGVKLQIAFYEQYGVPGLQAFEDTIKAARERNLIIIVDAKRNDISSTAKAYANAFLGRSAVFGKMEPAFDVDCITVSPFLGRDSLQPFVDTCAEHGKGIFILVKTSNPSSVDFQDQSLISTKKPLYETIAKMVDDFGKDVIGDLGYSSIGAVVGATFPEEATHLREIMPRNIILVPGYGAQGGTAKNAIACFNKDGMGAVVNASRSITYAYQSLGISKEHYVALVRSKTTQMIKEMTEALKAV